MVTQSPFQLIFPPELWGAISTENKCPVDCSYRMNMANLLLSKSKKGSFLVQSYSGFDYMLELWSFITPQGGFVDLIVKQAVITFSIMLKGEIQIQQPQSGNVLLHEKMYRLIYLAPGKERLSIQPGEVHLLFVTPPSNDLHSLTCEHSDVMELVTRSIYNTSNKPAFLKSTPLGQYLMKNIRTLLNINEFGAALDLMIRKNILSIIYYYNKSLTEKNILETGKHLSADEIAYLVYDYILNNFTSPQLGGMNEMCYRFHISSKTLRKHFQMITGRSVPEFIKYKRMTMAKQLLSLRKLPISDVCHKVGYSEPSNFIRDFKHFFGHSPKYDQRHFCSIKNRLP